MLVLLTDGDNNVEAKITPLQAAMISRMFDVIVHTVGIGSDRAFVIQQDIFRRQQLRNWPVSFNESLMQDISRETNGRYFAAEDADGLRRVMKEIDALEKTSMEQPTYVDYKDLYRHWVYAGIGLLFFGLITEHSICLKVP